MKTTTKPRLTKTKQAAKAWADNFLTHSVAPWVSFPPAKHRRNAPQERITVEWIKSRTWGMNPRVEVSGPYGPLARVSGCGYCKLSAVLSEALQFLIPEGEDRRSFRAKTHGCGESALIFHLASHGYQLQRTFTTPATTRDEFTLSPIPGFKGHLTRHELGLAKLLHPECPDTVQTVLRKLRRLELTASRAATAQCNGEAYQGQPYREDFDWDTFTATVEAKTAEILGYPKGTVPSWIYYNTDPRGYALKVVKADSDASRRSKGLLKELPEGLERDFGGYGILAPEKR